MNSRLKLLPILIFILFFITLTLADDLYKTQNHYWEPAEDYVYLQETSKKIPTDEPLISVAEYEGRCYTVMNKQIYILMDNVLAPLQPVRKNVKRLLTDNASLWALAEDGLYRLNNDDWFKVDNREYVDICMHNGALHAATRNDIFRLENNNFFNINPKGGYHTSDATMIMEDGTQVLANPVQIGPIDRIDSYNSTLHVLQPGRLVLFDGRVVNRDFIDWGTLPSRHTHDMQVFGSRLFISTDRGLAVLRGSALTTLKGKDGLPFEETTCLTRGFDNDLWIGTTKGAIRMLTNDWHYFGAHHWLPGDKVNDIAVSKNIVYIATDAGLGIISYEPYTLLKKADYYEQHLDKWGHKRLGFIHTIYKHGDDWIREISDNDGGHTAPYLAAMCYKYAVTKDKNARQEAVDAFKAMLWLDRITPIDGFIARAIWSTTGDKDKMSTGGSGGLPAKWYPTKDGKWYWKGDTSSDEVIAHFYSVSLFHDLVAQGKEKDLAKEHLARIASYIMDNGWVLKDMDGKPTRWGRWDPKNLLTPYGSFDKGLNGLEAQTFMRSAYALTGDKKYEKGFQQLLDWGYHKYTVRQKNTFPPENVVPWDDNLAFRSYYTLLRYTDDPNLKSIYLRSLARTWEVKRIEQVAWFNFIYGAITGNDCEVDKAVQRLREWTIDCVEHNYENSFRDDLFTEPGYVPYTGGTRAMSPRETSVKRASRFTLDYDGGAHGYRVMEPTGFLRDYWMGRYHGFIKAPSTKKTGLISVKHSKDGHFGAEPYQGEPRPKIY